MLAQVAMVVAPSMLPGWALATVLDGSGDRLRKALLAPALGLLLMFGASGTLLAAGLWSAWSLVLVMVGMNIVAFRTINVRHEEVAQWTRWQRLEAAMAGLELDELNPALELEAEQQRLIRKGRHRPLMVLGVVLSTLALASPILQSVPFGVDWIGFAMLAQQAGIAGEFTLSGANQGFWTYPPAFPSLAGYLGLMTSADTGRAVFVLGHYSLFVLLLGLMGAMDRYGAGAQVMLAMGYGLALFAKVFDSGYPSVASQLGLVVGLLVLLRPSQDRHRHHTTGLVLAIVCVALVHPTGAIYLALLLLSHLLHGMNIEDDETRAVMRTMAYVASGLFTLGMAVALLVFAPRLFDEAVFSEYGWQGGRPMLVYNGPLLVLGLWAGLALRRTLEGRILITWFVSLWLLSLIHLIEGLQHVPVLSLMSYTLYSMALHAFHVPLAAMVALWWSPSSRLTPLEPSTYGASFRPPQVLTAVLTVGVMVGAGAAAAVAVTLSTHDELWAVSPGDLAVREALSDLEGVVYTENMHWGYVWDVPERVTTTSIPSLGLVHIDDSEHPRASLAIYYNNLTYMQETGMNHALTSPLGSMQWELATSAYWERLQTVDGATLWRHVPNGTAPVNVLEAVDSDDCESCTERMDIWRDHRFRDPLELGATRAFSVEGTPERLALAPPAAATSWCIVYEVVGEVDSWTMKTTSGTERPVYTMRTDPGFHRTCMGLTNGSSLTGADVTWSSTTPTRWLNPLGLSGRDDVLIDHTGVRWHWHEWVIEQA